MNTKCDMPARAFWNESNQRIQRGNDDWCEPTTNFLAFVVLLLMPKQQSFVEKESSCGSEAIATDRNKIAWNRIIDADSEKCGPEL